MKLGDFSALAKSYINRPAYDVKLIAEIMKHMNVAMPNICIADIGAGTGKLTKVLAEMGCKSIYAVEPNNKMRYEGIKYTDGFPSIKWSEGTGEATGLSEKIAHWVTMASSFHWTDPNKSLPEFNRILKKDGYLSIIWNTRDVASSKLHTDIENIIYKMVPNIKRVSSGHSAHTKNWNEILVSTGHFGDVKFIETSYVKRMSGERYINAWRSVNDIQVQAGPKKFERMLEEITQMISHLSYIDVPYRMRSWTARKV